MNKRIMKKKDLKRRNDFLEKAESLVTTVDYYFKHSHYGFFLHCLDLHGSNIYSDIYWDEYDKWISSTNGKRCWTHIMKKNNIPKHI